MKIGSSSGILFNARSLANIRRIVPEDVILFTELSDKTWGAVASSRAGRRVSSNEVMSVARSVASEDYAIRVEILFCFGNSPNHEHNQRQKTDM